MGSKSILITGGHGFLGWFLTNGFAELEYSVYCTHISENNRSEKEAVSEHRVDITEKENVTDVIRKTCPDVIVHAAAITDVDKCEREKSLAHKVNVLGTENIVDAAEEINAHVLFISSSFVFDGSREKYTEKDTTNPVNHYGKTKAEAEDIIKNSNIPYAIIRTDQPYGWPETWQKHTMVSWTLEKLNERGKVSIFKNWYNNPTYRADILNISEKIIETQKQGIFHATGPEYLNRYEWAVKIAEEFNKDASRIKPTRSDKEDFAASRPNVRMDNSNTVKELNVDFTSIDQGLHKMREEKNEY